MRRFRVEDQSMLPALHPGQGLIAIRWGRRRPGQIRVVRHPRAEMWIVKRLSHRVPGAGRVDGEPWIVTADNSAVGVDSRVLGAIDMRDSWLVVVAVPRRWM